MALQKRRLGKSRIRHRRSAWMSSMKKPLVSSCPNCAEPKLPHRVCMKCGQYDGDVVIEVKSDDED